MRDNEERFQVPDSGESAASHTDANLNLATPTEFVELPSGGKLYPEGHPLHGKDTVEIRFMTAKEEDILTSKALIKKGVAIDRMLQSILIDKNLKVEKLLLGDKNALTMAARISGYGSEYEVQMVCPSCEAKVKHTFDLEEVGHVETKDLSELGVEQTDRGTFVVSLVRSNVKVEVRLLTGADEAQLLSEVSQTKSAKKEENNSTSQLKRMIVSVNGETDRQVVNQFIHSMPAIDARFLRKILKDVTPDVDMTQEFECSSCGHEEEVEIPFTVEFFWPK